MKFNTVLAIALLGWHVPTLVSRADDSPVSGQQRMGTPAAPTAEPDGFDKCRFISFVAPSGGGDSALRVRLTSLHHVDPPYTGATTVAFTAFEGQSVWVGPPATFVESFSFPIEFKVSFTQCQPHYQDWSTVGLLHVTGSATAPSSIFHVENVADVCIGIEETTDCQSGGAHVSSQLEIRTTRWGDVDLPFHPPSGTRQPDIGDLTAIHKKFRSIPQALIKARALLGAQTVFGEISVATLSNDIGLSQMAYCIDAFTGASYRFKMGKCAGAATPPANGACSSDSECTGTNGAAPCNLYCP